MNQLNLASSNILQVKPVPKSYKSSIEASNKSQALITPEYSRRNRMFNKITLESGYTESPMNISDVPSPTVHLNQLIRKTPSQEF